MCTLVYVHILHGFIRGSPPLPKHNDFYMCTLIYVHILHGFIRGMGGTWVSFPTKRFYLGEEGVGDLSQSSKLRDFSRNILVSYVSTVVHLHTYLCMYVFSLHNTSVCTYLHSLHNRSTKLLKVFPKDLTPI